MKKKYSLTLYDPVIKKLKSKEYNFSDSISDSIKNAQLIFIMTPWSHFKTLNSKRLIKILKKKIIIDPFGVMNDKSLIKNSKKYFSIVNNT